MEATRYDRITRTFTARPTAAIARRTLLQRGAALSAVGLGIAAIPNATAAKALCLKNGSPCKPKKGKKGKTCKAGNCLQAPFTIEARWSNPTNDHDAYLVVPNAPGASLPRPFLNYACTSGKTGAGGLHPFAYVNQDATGPGDEVTTVAFLLDGKYEYWVALDLPAPSGEITVDLRNKNGQIIRTWTSPVNQDAASLGWHVFDINGQRQSVTSINQFLGNTAFSAAFEPSTRLCL